MATREVLGGWYEPLCLRVYERLDRDAYPAECDGAWKRVGWAVKLGPFAVAYGALAAYAMDQDEEFRMRRLRGTRLYLGR